MLASVVNCGRKILVKDMLNEIYRSCWTFSRRRGHRFRLCEAGAFFASRSMSDAMPLAGMRKGLYEKKNVVDIEPNFLVPW